MAAFHVARKTIKRSVITLLGAAVILAVSSILPSINSQASAESYSSGVVLRKGASRKKFSSRSSTRSSARSGVYQVYGRKYQKHHRKQYKRNFRKYSDRGLIERRRNIEARNRRVAFENAERRNRNAFARTGTGAGVIVLGDDRQGIFSSDFDGGVAGTVLTQTTPCPRSHNCGYRIYSDGTGPRIITPGVSAGGNLPAFDGLSGPQVITLD